MTFDNPYFVGVLVIVVVMFHLDLIADLLNLSALAPKVPNRFKEAFDEEKYEKARHYTGVTTRFGILEASASLAIFLVFWLGGGFAWLDGWTRSFGAGPILTGLAAIGLLALASALVALPFEAYDTFVIEAEFGFNRTTAWTFIVDRVKSLVLTVILGGPILALLLYFFGRFSLAWVYAWAAVSCLSIALAYAAPRFLLPIFNRFKPLEDGELKSAIEEMAQRCGFPLAEVSVMDGSRRSSKSNAIFTGFGRHKRIALYDTLVERHSVPELVAVLAHEIGHYARRHVIQQLAFGILHTGILLFLLGRFLESDRLFAAFGTTPSVHFALVFFGILFRPINRVLSIGMAAWSRKNEYEADAYAAEVTGRPDALASALRKLAADNLANLTPHPFYVLLHYSHPPMIERIRALES